MKRLQLYLAVLLTITVTQIFSQTIVFDPIETGPYGQGSSIAVLFRPQGIFPINNVFELYLSDVNGNFNGSEVKIGEYASHYSTFINGVIPTGANSSAKYKLQIKANGQTVKVSSFYSIQVVNSPGTGGQFINTDIDLNPIAGKWLWVACSGNALDVKITNKTGKEIKGIIKNEFDTTSAFGSDVPKNYTVNPNSNTTISPLNSVHYRLLNRILETASGVISTQAWFVVNNLTVGPFSAVLNTVCFTPTVPGEFKFKVDIDRVISTTQSAYYNFPGYVYEANWDDGSKTQITIQQIDGNGGLITHGYSKSSCGETVNTNGKTYFNSIGPNLKVKLINPPCIQDVNTISPIQVFQKPEIKFVGPFQECEGNTVTFTNTSILGLQGNSNVPNCMPPNITFEWYVDGKLVKSSSTLDSYSTSSLAPGPHTIRLDPIFSKNAVPCPPASYSQQICIEKKPIPLFLVNDKDSIAECAASTLTVKTTNKTLKGLCSNNTWQWSVYNDSTNTILSAPADYKVDKIDTITPTFTFNQPGRYRIELQVTNSCGPFSTSRIVTLLATGTSGSVKLPPNTGYCVSSKTIDFGADPAHKPTYSSKEGGETYQWTVSGTSTYNFLTATNIADPKIAFNGYGTYTVSVTFTSPTNNCGIQTAKQQIIFSEPVTVDAGPPTTTACYSQNFITLTGTVNPVAKIKWTSSGTGTFSADSLLSTNYNISNTDKQSGSITLSLAAVGIGACTGATDQISLTIFPDNFGTNTLDTICTGTKLNYVPVSSLSGSTYSWTSKITKGNVSGNSASGNGSITDVLINNDSTTISEVVYTITPKANNCTGKNFTYTVTIQPVPLITAIPQPSIICSGTKTNIQLASNLSTTNYSWTSSVVSGTATGNSNLSNQGGPVADLLINTGSTDAIVRYSVSGIGAGPGFCKSSVKTVDITVSAAVSGASAGTDQVLCNDVQTKLSGNNPATGSGTWTQAAGPAVTIVSNKAYNSDVTGLTAGNTYKLVWTIKSSNGSCGLSSDTVDITIRPVTTKANAGNDSSFCSAGVNSFNLKANTPASFETGTWSVISSGFTPLPSFDNINKPDAVLLNLQPGTVVLKWEINSDATGCAKTTDTVKITIGATTEAAMAGSDQKLCNVTTANLNATAVSSPSLGNWKSLSGATVSDVSSAVSKVDNLVIGDNKFVWTVTNSFCPNANTDTVNLIVRKAITKAAAGNDTVFCGSSGSTSYKLSANTAGVFETGTWTIISNTMSGNPNFTDENDASATISNLSPGILKLRWTITNDGGCVPSASDIQITIAGSSDNADAGIDQQLCNQTSSLLNAVAVTSPSIGKWTVISPISLIVSDTANPKANLAGLLVGVNKLIWTVTNNVCAPKRDTLVIVVSPRLINHIDTSTQTICSGQSATLAGQTPTGGNGTYTYQWQQSTTGSNFTDIAGETNANITVSPLQPTWYRRYVKSLPCENAGDTVKIVVLAGISNNTIGQSQAICINTAANIVSGQTPAGGGGNYRFTWEKSIDAGTTWQKINGESAADYNPGILTATTWYRRVVATQLCDGPQGAASNIVIITVNPDAKALFEPLKTLSCAPFSIDASTINQTPFSDRNGSFEWFANNNLIGSGSFPGYSIATPGDSVLIKLVAISKFGCKNDSMQLWFYSPVNPKPSFTLSDTVGCGPITITIKNRTPDAGNYSFIWDFGNGQTSTDSQPAQVVFATNPTYGDTVYTVTLKATGGCDTISSVQYIRIKSKPKSLFTPSAVQGCSPMAVTFTNTSRGSNASFTWDFGDGSPQVPAISTSIQHTFFTGFLDTFYVKLFGKNDCGIDTQQYAIVVNPNAIKLNVAVNGNQVNGCAPHNVLFVNNTRGANLFRWNFGDGSPELTTTKGVDSVLHTYTQTGLYNVSLFATNSCSDTSTTLKITVETGPAVSFTAIPTVLCVGQPVAITNTSESGLAWAWRFGDGAVSSLRTPVKTFSKPGLYRIILTGTKTFAQGFGCSDTAFADIIVKDTLAGNFTVDSAGSCAPVFVTFKNTNLPAVKTIWDFGDGGTAAGDSVTHIFRNEGRFAVVMIAQASGGCRYRDEKTIVVNGPSGELRYTGGYVCPPNTVQFEVISNNTSIYRFYFGNGDSLVTSNPVVNYTYKKPGTYLPSVVLVTGNCSRLIKGIDSVKIENISAGFKTATTFICGSTTISFTDSSSAYYALNKWEWGFGDGTSSLQRNPFKTFITPGTYNVQLKVTSTSGCTSLLTVPLAVQVRNKPVSQIANSPLLCTSNNIVFTSSVVSADSVAASSWNFGNGATAIGTTVSYTYANAATYTVTLISRTAFGCADTVKKIITINQSPLVNAGADIRLCLGQSAPLTATGAAQMQWSPTQGLSCTNCSNTVAKPVVTTLYAVTGTNAAGCPNTDSVLVDVVKPLSISVNANDTICIGQSSQLFASGAATYRWNPTVGLNTGNVPNPVAKPLTTTTYTVVGFDAYSCFTDTAFVTVAVGQYPVVNLGTGALVIAGTAVQLSPALTNGPFKSYTWTPASLLSCTNCANPVATINNNLSYQLVAENIYGCTGRDTINYQVICSKDDQVYIPNAFSPDGDGINDVFMVQGKGVLVDYFRVFNRWGQIVFDGGSNYRPNEPAYGWNGKINGKPATQDVYVYTVQVRCTAGGTFTYKGNVSLLYMR